MTRKRSILSVKASKENSNEHQHILSKIHKKIKDIHVHMQHKCQGYNHSSITFMETRFGLSYLCGSCLTIYHICFGNIYKYVLNFMNSD